MPAIEVLHNITPDRVLFCYRKGDKDSLEIAQYYAAIRHLQSFQLCPLPVSDVEEIDYNTYLNDVEKPILEWIKNANTESSAGHGHNELPFVFCIILGYNVPRILNYYGERIALASRVHRLGHPVELKIPNHTFDRKTWKYFDDIDNRELYVTAVLDGPTKNDVINLINRGNNISNQGKISGKIVLDPYGNKLTDNQIEYQQEILDFIQYDVDSFGSEWSTTVDIDDPYQDPTVAYLQDESFYWGWYQRICSPQMFKDGRAARVFCYNADNGPVDVKDAPLESGSWSNISLQISNPGYASTAASFDVLGNEEEYVFPRPFFFSLHQVAGIGEAFLTANRYVDWKMAFVGDPLTTILFPLEYTDTVKNSLICREIVYRSIRKIEDYLNKVDRLNVLINDCLNLFLYNPSFDKQNIFYSNNDWKNKVINTEQYVAKLITGLVQYQFSASGSDWATWITSEDIKTSVKFSDTLAKYTSQTVPATNIRSNDHWELDFTYIHNKLTLENVYFVIEIATDSYFTNIVYAIRLSDSISGWYYEKEPYIFMSLPVAGFPSNYSGRRTRYVSTEETILEHTNLYYYRILLDDASVLWVTLAEFQLLSIDEKLNTLFSLLIHIIYSSIALSDFQTYSIDDKLDTLFSLIINLTYSSIAFADFQLFSVDDKLNTLFSLLANISYLPISVVDFQLLSPDEKLDILFPMMRAMLKTITSGQKVI